MNAAIRIAVIASCLVLPLSAQAGRLSDDEAGRISAEIDVQKQEYLDKEFGGRSYDKLNSQEKRQYLKKSDEIERGVLKQNNVSQASYSTSMMRAHKNSPVEKARAEHTKRIAEEKKAAAEKKAASEKTAAEGSQAKSGTPGTTKENGVTVERNDLKSGSRTTEGGVTVDRGGGAGAVSGF